MIGSGTLGQSAEEKDSLGTWIDIGQILTISKVRGGLISSAKFLLTARCIVFVAVKIVVNFMLGAFADAARPAPVYLGIT